eukprot:gene5157-8763_t
MTDNIQVISFVVRLAGGMSLLGGLFVMIHFLLFKELRQGTIHKLIFLQGMSDFMAGLIYFLFGANVRIINPYFCQFQGYLSTYFDLFSCMCPGAIITQILLLIISVNKKIRTIIIYILIFLSFFIPFILTMIVFSTQDVDQILDGWCWIKDKEARLYLFYIPIWSVMLYVLVIYFLIGIIGILDVFQFRKSKTLDHTNWKILYEKIRANNWKIIRNYSLFPLIFLISYFFATTKRIFDSATQDKYEILGFSILLSLGLQGRGLYNAIAFFITQNVLKLYINIFKMIKKKFWDREIKKKERSDSMDDSTFNEESIDEIRVMGHEPTTGIEVEMNVDSDEFQEVIGDNNSINAP